MGKTILQRGRPRFYLWLDELNAYGSRYGLTGAMDFSRQAVSFTHTKALASPAGQWSVTLAPRGPNGSATPQLSLPDLLGLDPLGAVVSLGYDEDGGFLLGTIDNYEEVHIAGGQFGLQLRGRDLGSVLMDDSIIRGSTAVERTPQYLAAIREVFGAGHPLERMMGDSTWGPLAGGGNAFLGVTLKQTIDWLLTQTFSMQLPTLSALGGKGFPGEYLCTDRCVTDWGDPQVFNYPLHAYQGNLFGFLQQVIGKDFYELWVDSEPVGELLPAGHLIVRPKPFDESGLDFAEDDRVVRLGASESTGDGKTRNGWGWKGLQTMVNTPAYPRREHHIIEQGEWRQARLGRNRQEALSHYQVFSNHTLLANEEAEKNGLDYPLTDTYMAKRFGLRGMRSSLRLAEGDLRKQAKEASYTAAIFNEAAIGRNRLFNWYRLNPFFERGQITVAGRDAFRVGDPVYLPWKRCSLSRSLGMRYYCTGVSRQWSATPTSVSPYLCTLTLERGHNEDTIADAKYRIALDAPVTNRKHFAET